MSQSSIWAKYLRLQEVCKSILVLQLSNALFYAHHSFTFFLRSVLKGMRIFLVLMSGVKKSLEWCVSLHLVLYSSILLIMRYSLIFCMLLFICVCCCCCFWTMKIKEQLFYSKTLTQVNIMFPQQSGALGAKTNATFITLGHLFQVQCSCYKLLYIKYLLYTFTWYHVTQTAVS